MRPIRLVLPLLLFASCITYGAYKIPLEGDSPAGRIWVSRHLEVLQIDGEDFKTNLNAAWITKLGLTYATHEFFIAPGEHEFVVGYKRVEFNPRFLNSRYFSTRRYAIRVDVAEGSHTVLCAVTHDLRDPDDVRYVAEARRYEFPEDFIPEDVIYVESLTKLLPPEECQQEARQGQVLARGVLVPDS